MQPPVKLDYNDSDRVRTQKLIKIYDDLYSNMGSINRVTDVVTEELHISVGAGGGSNGGMSTVSHSILADLTTGDPHTQYPFLNGRYGGQVQYGDTEASGNYTVSSTINTTKGHIYFGASGAFIDFNESDERVGINAATTSAWKLRIHSTSDQELFMTHQTADAVGATVMTYKQRGTTTECNDADEVFSLDNRFLNDNSEYIVGGEYKVVVDDITATTEDAHVELHAQSDGSLVKSFEVYGTKLAIRGVDTDVTGTELETLSDGSNADALHIHATNAHTHDGDTLQLDGINSDGGAFPFTTSGAITITQNLLVGSAGAAMTLDASNERLAINTTTSAAWKFRIHSTSDQELFMTHQTADAVGATILTYKQRAADTACNDADEVFSLESKFLNDGTPKTYEMAGQYAIIVDDVSDGSEDSHIAMSVLNGGSAAEVLDVYGDYIKVNNYIKFLERSSDPPEPAEGEAILWMSDGTGKGADGDIIVASQAGGTTKYGIIFIHASNPGW